MRSFTAVASLFTVLPLLVAGCDDPQSPSATVEVRVVKTGSGNGRVTAPAAGIDCGTVCEGTVARGSNVRFSQATDSGSQFEGWYQPSLFDGPPVPCGTATVCDMGAASDFSLWAAFERVVTLTLVMNGPGSGSVRFFGGGVNGETCSTSCEKLVWTDEYVYLTAIPDSGSTFVQWSGPATCDQDCFVTLTENTEVTVSWGAAPAVR